MTRLALLLAGLVGLGACAEPAEPSAEVVAVVGDGVVTLDEVAEAYAEWVVTAGIPASAAALDATVASLVNRRLLIQEALDGGVRDTPGYQAAQRDARDKALIDLYTATERAADLAVTDADLRETFVQINTVYDARHLYARDRATADALRQRLLGGETFEALARETFADSTLAASGGRLGEFGHDDLDPAFEAAAFRLPVGQVSEPVRTATGYSVIRVDARASNPLLTESDFARKQDDIRRYVRKRKRIETRFALSRAVRDELAPRFEAGAFERLNAFATGAAPALDAEALADWRRTPLVRFASSHLDGVWTVGDVEDRAESMTERQRGAVQDAATLRDFIEGLLVRDELVARAQAAGLERDPRVRQIVTRALDDWVFESAKRRLRFDGDIPEDSLRAHWAARTADFVMPERVRAREILVATRAQADALRDELAAGADFAALARARSIRSGGATFGGDLGPVSRAQLGRLAGPVFDATAGSLVGPVEVAGRYVVVERGETVPARPMTFAEARPLVRQALDVPFAQRRLAAAVSRLRDQYTIRVDRDALAPLLAVSAS